MRRRKTNNRQLTKEKELFWAVAAGNYRLRPLLLPFEHISASRSRISQHCRSSRNKKQFRNGCKVMLSVELTMTNYEQQKYEISAEWNRQKNAKIICMNSDAKLFKSKHDVKFVFEKKKKRSSIWVFFRLSFPKWSRPVVTVQSVKKRFGWWIFRCELTISNAWQNLNRIRWNCYDCKIEMSTLHFFSCQST